LRLQVRLALTANNGQSLIHSHHPLKASDGKDFLRGMQQ